MVDVRSREAAHRRRDGAPVGGRARGALPLPAVRERRRRSIARRLAADASTGLVLVAAPGAWTSHGYSGAVAISAVSAFSLGPRNSDGTQRGGGGDVDQGEEAAWISVPPSATKRTPLASRIHDPLSTRLVSGGSPP